MSDFGTKVTCDLRWVFVFSSKIVKFATIQTAAVATDKVTRE